LLVVNNLYLLTSNCIAQGIKGDICTYLLDMPIQHSKFLAAYEGAPSRPPIAQLANYGYSMTGGLGGGGYIGLKSAVPNLLALSARLKPPRRASIDINRPAPDDFFMNKGGRSYDVVPSLIFERPSAGINSARSKTRAIQQKAAVDAEIAVTRRFYERINAPTLNFEGGVSTSKNKLIGCC
jgi:hypothetical protein